MAVGAAQHQIANKKGRPSGGGLSMWAAIVWMCRNQLGRRNITDEQRTYLIGEAYRAQKMTSGGDRRSEEFSSLQNEDLKVAGKTKDIIAKQFNVGGSTVERASRFVEGLDAAETVSKGFKEAILTGTVKAPKNVIQGIRNIPEAKRSAAVEAIKTGDVDTVKEIIRQSKPEPDGYAERGLS